MNINGTLINYYIHCRRQCYLFGNRLNFEENSEDVKIGKSLHEIRNKGANNEIKIDNIRVDKITKDYVVEVKKSDADIEASKWQLYLYLKILKDKGIIKKGKLECIEKNKTDKKIYYIELTEEVEQQLNIYIDEINNMLLSDSVPKIDPSMKISSCKKCAYYEYCYI